MIISLTCIRNRAAKAGDGMALLAPPALEPHRKHDQYQGGKQIICQRTNHEGTGTRLSLMAGCIACASDRRTSTLFKTIRIGLEKIVDVDCLKNLLPPANIACQSAFMCRRKIHYSDNLRQGSTERWRSRGKYQGLDRKFGSAIVDDRPFG